MLQNIVHNSHRLIKSQYLDQDSLLNQLIKLKAKKKNFSFYQTSYQGSIFQQPQFDHHIDLKTISKRNRIYMTSQNSRNRSKSQEASKTIEKMKPIKRNSKIQNQSHFTIDDQLHFKDSKKSKIIHSRKYMESLSIPKNPKIYHQRVYKPKQNFTKNNQIIEEPGLANLCFYKNTLQQINIMRSARLSMRKKSPQRNLSQRQKMNKTKIIFMNNKGNKNDKNPDCRPWSPKNDNDSVEGDFLCFKSLSLKL